MFIALEHKVLSICQGDVPSVLYPVVTCSAHMWE